MNCDVYSGVSQEVLLFSVFRIPLLGFNKLPGGSANCSHQHTLTFVISGGLIQALLSNREASEKHSRRRREGGREKLKCGPHFVLIYWNQYCDAFISTNFTGRQFRFYHVYTVILVYVSCLEIRFMCFQVVQIKRQHYLTS